MRALPNKSMYGWTGVPVPCRSLNPGITKTLSLQVNYLIDVKRAKNTLIIQANFPNFPDTLWTDVLLNKYIDLNHIFSGHYALKPNA